MWTSAMLSERCQNGATYSKCKIGEPLHWLDGQSVLWRQCELEHTPKTDNKWISDTEKDTSNSLCKEKR